MEQAILIYNFWKLSLFQPENKLQHPIIRFQCYTVITMAADAPGFFLLTWINFNPNMDM